MNVLAYSNYLAHFASADELTAWTAEVRSAVLSRIITSAPSETAWLAFLELLFFTPEQEVIEPLVMRSKAELQHWHWAVRQLDYAAPLLRRDNGIVLAVVGVLTMKDIEDLAGYHLQALAKNVDGLIVGGGIANTFMLAAGLKIGKSLAEPDLIGEAKAVIDAMKARGAAVPIPTDVVCAKSFSPDAVATVKAATDVADDDLILDIGPETAQLLAEQLKKAGTIVWNGPVGVFEFAAFENGTKVIAHAIAESSAFSIAGGGDTLAAIAKYGIEKDVGYISTGGGAFLEVLEGKTLPAFEVLARRAA